MRIAIFIPNIVPACGRPAIALSLIQGLREQHVTSYLITNSESNSKLYNSRDLISLIIPCNPESKSIYKFFISIIKLQKFIKENKIDIIHAHHRYAEFISIVTRRIFNLRVKIIITVHSFTTDMKRVSYRSDLIIAVSRYIENHLVNHYNKNAEKICVIHNGVKRERKHNHEDTVSNQKTVLGIGRFEKEKGFDILLNAMMLLQNNSIHLKLVLVGEGSEKKELKLKIKKSFLDVSFYFTETTPWELISRAAIVIVPSRIETLGLVILEAGLLGKCVVASDTGGIPELIENGVNGFLFENENWKELAVLINRIIQDDQLAKRLGNELKKKVEVHFSYNTMINKYITEYKELLK